MRYPYGPTKGVLSLVSTGWCGSVAPVFAYDAHLAHKRQRHVELTIRCRVGLSFGQALRQSMSERLSLFGYQVGYDKPLRGSYATVSGSWVGESVSGTKSSHKKKHPRSGDGHEGVLETVANFS